jgi:predicted ABC-type ATPase
MNRFIETDLGMMTIVPPAGRPAGGIRAFNPDQPRDPSGKWTSGAGGGGGASSTGGSGGGSSGGSTPAGPPMTQEAANARREAHRKARKPEDYAPVHPDQVETDKRFQTSDGNYTPARAAMHDEIVGDALAGVPKSDNPTLYMMGGGPAAGKSSIINNGDVTHPDRHVLANPDVFKEDIPEYRAGLAAGNLDAAKDAHEESSHLNGRVMAAAAAGGHDTVWDGTGDSSIEKLEQRVTTFKRAGFTIQADYVTCDTDAAVARATARAAKTGRQVPESDIRRTHAKVSAIWPEAVRRGLFDRSTLYDTNAGGRPVRIASAEGTKLTIHNQAAYDRFLAKADG